MNLTSFRNYLKNSNYEIKVYDNFIYLKNYLMVDTINEKMVVINFSNFKTIIDGNHFVIIKMVDNEILIKGDLYKIEFI